MDFFFFEQKGKITSLFFFFFRFFFPVFFLWRIYRQSTVSFTQFWYSIVQISILFSLFIGLENYFSVNFDCYPSDAPVFRLLNTCLLLKSFLDINCAEIVFRLTQTLIDSTVEQQKMSGWAIYAYVFTAIPFVLVMLLTLPLPSAVRNSVAHVINKIVSSRLLVILSFGETMLLVSVGVLASKEAKVYYQAPPCKMLRNKNYLYLFLFFAIHFSSKNFPFGRFHANLQ